MRGDLVFEKLGEIDPELVADALQKEAPLMDLDTLTTSRKPSRGAILRRLTVIAACILLAGLFLVGGGTGLFLIAVRPFEENTSASEDGETESALHGYEGVFRIYDISGTQLLFAEQNPDHADAVREIISILNRATEPAVYEIESPGNFTMTVGDTTLTVRYGMLYNKASGQTYAFAEGDWERFRTLIREICGYFPDGLAEPPGYITYEYVTRHRKDVYSLSVTVHNSLYVLKSLTLEHEGGDFVVSTQLDYFAEEYYFCTIPEDAPLGNYTAYAAFETPYSDQGSVLECAWPSVLTVVEHEKEPAYTFEYGPTEIETLYHYGDTLTLHAALTNLGDDLYRYGSNTVLHPKVELRIRRGDEMLSFKMTDEWITEDGEQIRFLKSEKKGESGEYVLRITEDMPEGMYDLVLSFEGHEEVYPQAFTVTVP